MVKDSEGKISKPGSNFISVRYINFCINNFAKNIPVFNKNIVNSKPTSWEISFVRVSCPRHITRNLCLIKLNCRNDFEFQLRLCLLRTINFDGRVTFSARP